MKIERFEDIKAWQEARLLTNMVFDITDGEHIARRYRFTSQIESAAVSVMNNIAEGFARKSDKEFIQFLFVSKGSASEVQSMLHVCLDRKFITKTQFDKAYEQSDKTARMISNFIKYLRNQT
jgi:four helix bundle protein